MAKKNRWFLPTNTDNLKMMVAQGLITSPDGFSPNKYYKDELENYHGFIPLFKNRIPQKTLDLIVSEQDNMLPCLIEIDISKIIDIDKNDDELLLLPEPLPLSCIDGIIFKSAEDKKSLEYEQKLSNNFILADLKTTCNKADAKLFTNNDNAQIPLEEPEEIVNNDSKEKTTAIDYKKIYAYGGLLINLFYFAKNGSLSDGVYQSFCNLKINNKNSLTEDKLAVYKYFSDNNNNNMLQIMYSKLLSKAIDSQDFKNDLIVLLEADDWGENLQRRTQELAKTLREFEKNDMNISQKFEHAKTPLEKLLMMLFHKDNSEDLTRYQLDSFNEEDYLLFALVFGMRNKFIQSPKFIKEYQGLRNFVSSKMAEYAHTTASNEIKFKSQTTPKTVWDILNTHKTGKKAVEKLDIKNCVQTVISGDYQHHGNKNIYQGFVEPKYEIVEEEYFKTSSKKNIETITYNDLAKLK